MGSVRGMPNTNSRLLVAAEGTCAVVRVCGRASFTCSADFKLLAYELLGKGIQCFILDLTGCVIMDSTFLGILARFAQRLAEAPGGPHRLVLHNPNSRILDLLDNLGVSQLFEVRQVQATSDTAFQEVSPRATDKVEATRVALEAHQTLMEISPGNVAKFKEVAEFMANDLRRMEKGQGKGEGE